MSIGTLIGVGATAYVVKNIGKSLYKQKKKMAKKKKNKKKKRK